MIEPSAASSRIQVLSLQRAYGIPSYRGRMEIVKKEQGLLLINELLLEEYLYSVVPSEMPSSYPAEALEAQAVEPDTIERFVVAKDSKLNCLFVGSAAQAASESCVLENVTWTSIQPLEEKRSCRVRFARGDNPRPCQLVPIEDGKLMMSFTMPVTGLASGKTAVFYSDDMVLGGGTIA